MDGVLGLPAHTDGEALRNFIDGLLVAESAAKQLAYYTQNPHWINVEALVAQVRERATALAVRSLR